MTMKMRLKIKNRSQIFDISRHRPRHGHKHAMYEATPRPYFKLSS